MPFFLDLPPELRALIIEDVLNASRAPPAAPSKLDRAEYKDIAYKAYLAGNGKIYHQKRSTHCPSNCLPLLLTNSQISAETQSILDRVQPPRTDYHLDISVLDDLDLFPTWLSVPRITNRVSTLFVDVRLFGHIISFKTACRHSRDGHRLGMHWSFYALLERFVRYGPVDKKKGTPLESDIRGPSWQDRDVTVGTLILNFQSAESELPFPPDSVDYRRWMVRHVYSDLGYVGDPLELEKYTARPEWLAQFLAKEISGLLSVHTSWYGGFLYERIGTIRFLVDGESFREFNIASYLASLRRTHLQDTFGHEDRVPAFWKWKKETLARREQLGFPVVWPEDPELGQVP